MLDLRRMSLLCDLAELGSVSAVAERREITGSAVSQQLRVLEEEVGAVLLRREGRTLGLTPSGRVMVEHARQVLTAIDETLSAVAATRDRVAGRIAVASFNMGVPILAVPLMRRLRIAEPGIRVEVQQEESSAALRLLRRGEVDLAITCSYDFLGQQFFGGMTSETLLSEPLVLMAPAHWRQRVRSGGLHALADAPWVTGPPDSGLGVAVTRLADSAGFTARVEHRLVGAQNICDVAATEVAAAVVPLLAVPDRLAGLIVRDVDLGARRISAVMRDGRRGDPTMVSVLRVLRAVAADALAVPPAGRWSVAS
ncbi:LysR family transcriptional regulator [Tsukamurella soli]|uniref:LysR family transcriptional regulator n=1 Tax=Tsukamurella soli TaxID=644556 RepID=A0ABP8J5K9_9ACTN